MEDAAFIDGVDVTVHIGMPILHARYEILRFCLYELNRTGIILDSNNESNESLFLPFDRAVAAVDCKKSNCLLEVAKEAQGRSGRSLRKLPLQVHAQHIGSFDPVSLETFILALRVGVASELDARTKLKESYNNTLS
jgi:hypothetical protein